MRLFNKNLIFLIFIPILSNSCFYRKPIYPLYKFKDNYLWISNIGLNKYTFTMDSTKEIWFYGELVINDIDTFKLKGFAKGAHFPIVGITKDSIQLNRPLFIRSFDKEVDYLLLTKRNESNWNIIIPDSLILYKIRY